MRSWIVRSLLLVVPLVPAAASPPPHPAQPLAYWNVWVDGNGGTHQSRCIVHAFSPLSLGPGTQEIWIDKLPQQPGAVLIAQFPVGWTGQWHENPKPQWVIPLSGHWFVQTTDGHRVEMGPGDASFGGDQGARPDAAGHAGHLSGTLGDQPVTLMFVQGPAPVPADPSCRFE